ncbi:retrotransposon hot spot (RHS) protein, partial [Trypanosoma cruzi]
RARRSLRVTQINPAAARGRAEEAQCSQWSMSSSVKDILQERTTGTANMELNDFLHRESGEEWVVNRNGNYSMEMFFFEIQDVYPRRSVIGHDNGIAVLRRAG